MPTFLAKSQFGPKWECQLQVGYAKLAVFALSPKCSRWGHSYFGRLIGSYGISNGTIFSDLEYPVMYILHCLSDLWNA